MKRLTVLATVALLICCLSPVLADIVFEENFNSGTSGQWITDPPLNWPWTYYRNNVQITSGLHGWDGNALDGSTATGTEMFTKPLVLATTAQYELSCKVWVEAGDGGHVAIWSANGYWGWYHDRNRWEFIAGKTDFQDFPSNIGLESTVTCKTFLDYDAGHSWGDSGWAPRSNSPRITFN